MRLFDLLPTETTPVVGAGNLSRNRIAHLLPGESRLVMLTGPLALQGSVAETEALQFPNHQGVEIGPLAEVAKKGVRSSAEPTATQPHLKAWNKGPPLLLTQPFDRRLHERPAR